MDSEVDLKNSDLSDLGYTRGMGTYKPHFAGMPDSYYPLSCGEVCLGAIILILSILFTLGVMIGFQFWIVEGGLEGYTIAWVTVLFAFIAFAILCFYKGGKDRRRLEKQMIAESSRKQQEMMHSKR